MWAVYEQCNVYGDDSILKFENYNEALACYVKLEKSEDVCRGYSTLYLFQTLQKIDNPKKCQSEYDFDEETCELVLNNNPRIKLLSDGIVKYGQRWKTNDIGVVQYDNKYRIEFTINGEWHQIQKEHPMYDGEYEYIESK